ncbi:MAG TPA: spore germination protein, partial [Desulfosporosinus sp.]|nr:spore germination protein [Desulfosporosinus sp.]
MRPFRFGKMKKASEPELIQPRVAEVETELENPKLSSSLADNQTTMQTIFTNCPDFMYRELKIGQERVPVLLLYMNGLTDEQTVNGDILKSLVNIKSSNIIVSGSNTIEIIKNIFLEIGNITEITTIGE